MTNPPPVEVLIALPLSEALQERIRALSPRLRISYHPALKVDDVDDAAWRRCEVLFTDRVWPSPEQVPNLRWIQFFLSGVDFAANAPILHRPDVIATTMSGASAPQVSEYILLMLLALGHKMADMAALQSRAEWPRDRWERLAPFELRGSTVGFLSYGSIAREAARLLQPWGVKILAVKRDVMHPQDTGYVAPGLGDPEGELFTRLYPFEAIGSMLKLCDYVVNLLPLTPETRGLIGAPEFAQLKPTAYWIEVGRGGVVDQTALLNALQERRIAGAAFDVFPEEPLSSNSPFWRLPNVIISPHVAGISPHYHDRAVAVFIENLQFTSPDPRCSTALIPSEAIDWRVHLT